jgi:hypothetical protein
MRNYVEFFSSKAHVFNDLHDPQFVFKIIEPEFSDVQEEQALFAAQLTTNNPGWTVEYDSIERWYVLLNEGNIVQILDTAFHSFGEFYYYSYFTQTPPRATWSHGH